MIKGVFNTSLTKLHLIKGIFVNIRELSLSMDLYKMALLVKNCIFHLYSVEDYDFEKYLMQSILNFMFSNKATKIDEIFTVDLTL